MAQHDMNIANQGFPAFRSDLNNALSAIQTNHSGTSRPSGAVAGQIWLDTTSATTPTLKFYDGTDDISLATIDYSANTVNWLDSTVSADLIGDTSPQLGGMLDVNGNAIGDGVLELLKFIETASAVNELTITNSATANAPELSSTGDDTNIDIKITPKGSGNVVLDGLKYPNADGTADQVLKTDGSGNLSFTDVSGGISWQSSIVTTSTLTAVAGNGYWIDTTSNACTVTLPSSASVGDQIIFVDYARNWNTNNLTIDQNGLNYQGGTDNPVYDTNGQTVNIVYSGATNGWIPISDDDVANEGSIPTYSLEFLIVAGGGGSGEIRGAGGGAGGYVISNPSLPVGSALTVTVGAGGSAGLPANSGSNSSITSPSLSSIIAYGGGFGASANQGTDDGANGGSGGGATDSGTAGAGNTPALSPSQGNNGGTGGSVPGYGAGAGGGAGATGGNGSGSTGGAGGAGTASSITGSSVTRAGGGGGGAYSVGGGTGGPGGTGGGGNGNGGGAGGAGTANTGGGAGGGGNPSTGSASGGSGVVIIKVATADYSSTTTGSPTVTTSGSDTIMTFTGSGSYTT